MPSGAFHFESWKWPARQLVDDAGVSQSEKLSRLIGSLLPPASNIVLALGKSPSAEECLDGQEKAYGVTADGDELYLKFFDCYQRSRERLLRLFDPTAGTSDQSRGRRSNCGEEGGQRQESLVLKRLSVQ